MSVFHNTHGRAIGHASQSFRASMARLLANLAEFDPEVKLARADTTDGGGWTKVTITMEAEAARALGEWLESSGH